MVQFFTQDSISYMNKNVFLVNKKCSLGEQKCSLDDRLGEQNCSLGEQKCSLAEILHATFFTNSSVSRNGQQWEILHLL